MNEIKFDDYIKMIDIDLFAKHEAMRMLFSDNHAVAGDNLT